ncbi:MAG TPA: ABC transporter substrate-binding protein [Thermoplasmata archaeon]|nr:ABC transporter substrate-binding protein [Thermoplasmata archaeon]
MTLNPSGAAVPRPRRTIPATLFAVGLLVVAGAAVAATSVYYELRPATTPGSLHLTDDFGRSVTVPQDPGRVVVLGPSILDSMFRLGLRSHVVGVDCSPAEFGGLSGDYSPDQIALWSLAPSMCVQAEPLVVEQLLNATPDLVLATTIVSVADVETIDQVYHIPVVMLQPPTLSGVAVDVTLLGAIFGVAAAAAHLVGVISHGLANATDLATNLTDNGTPFPTVLVTYSTDSNGYWTYGPGTFGESLIELASASSIGANATLAYPELSGEQVLSIDPQILVYGTGFGLTESSYTSAPFWSSLSAVNDGELFGLDSNWLTEPDPTMILTGLPQLIAIFHPGSSA